jgi:hypothetical protein
LAPEDNTSAQNLTGPVIEIGLVCHEMKKLSEEWLERLRANAHIQTFAQ